MSSIIGHENILHVFERLIERSSLHHAYCFVGPKHVGKTAVALELCSKILHTVPEKLLLHPDFLLIERVDEEGNLKKDITVENIARVTSKIMMPPIAGHYNVVLIQEAEKMNSFAANALLKTLEEPSTPTIFFLLTESEEKILSTIRSRVQMIHLFPLSTERMKQGFASFDSVENFGEIISYAHGLPGLAKEWLESPESFENYKKEITRFYSLFGKPFFEKLALVEELFGEKKAHIEGRAELSKILSLWQTALGGMIALQRDGISSSSNTFPQIPSGTVVVIYDIIVQTVEDLARNVHPRLAVENILLTLP